MHYPTNRITHTTLCHGATYIFPNSGQYTPLALCFSGEIVVENENYKLLDNNNYLFNDMLNTF